MLNYYSLQPKSKKPSIPPPTQQIDESLIEEAEEDEVEVEIDVVPQVQKSNDVSEKWAHLERDPGKRPQIVEYHPNVRDEVSHHPPITALHATDEKENIEVTWCLSPKAKFYGSYIGIEFEGRRKVRVHSKKETYIISMPKVVIRLLPLPSIDWFGDVNIRCQETGIRADLCYRGNSFIPRSSLHRSIKGTIYMPLPSKDTFQITGYWDRTVVIEDLATGGKTLIYDAKETLSALKTPALIDPEGLSSTESSVVWSEVSEAILTRCWDKAREAKTCVEEKQRELARIQKSSGENWIPKHFRVSYSKETGWDCSPINKLVPPGPIVVPLRFLQRFLFIHNI